MSIEEIVEIRSYQTSDKFIFADMEAAKRHQRKIDFECWYELGSDKLSQSEESYSVHSVMLVGWLLRNREAVLEFLG